MSRRLTVILVYFGPLPGYFDLWLRSCGTNDWVTWLLVTDQAIEPSRLPPNVRIVESTLARLRDRISQTMGLAVSIQNAYKFCDFKPAYGDIFAEELAGSEYWGHCDGDVVWGRLDQFLTDEVFTPDRKILIRGHLSIYPNNEQGVGWYRLEPPPGMADYREAFAHPTLYRFDEWYGLYRILQHHQIDIFHEEFVADINSAHHDLRLNKGTNYRPQAFVWEQGRLLRYHAAGDGLGADEFAYIHLQKRRMAPPPAELITADRFVIGPDRFLPWPGDWSGKASLARVNPTSWWRDAMYAAGRPWRKYQRLRREAKLAAMHHE